MNAEQLRNLADKLVDDIARRTPFPRDEIAEHVSQQVGALFLGGGPDAIDPDAITLVDGEIIGTEDDLADVVEDIVADQLAQFMARR